MYISGFRRIDTTTFPGEYLSVVELSSGDGDGVSEAEVANTVHSDRDSIDAVMFTCRDGDVLGLEGIHRMIRSIRPPLMDTVLRTPGTVPTVLDDLIGAGYADHVLFVFDRKLTRSQTESVTIATSGDCRFSAEIMMDPSLVDTATLENIAETLRGARSITLRRVESPESCKPYRKSDLTSMAKSLRGMAKEVRLA